MEKKVINTKNAPSAIGPYSQGIKANGFVYSSGQLPIDPSTGKLIEDDIKAATKQSFLNLKAILEEAGSSLDKVVKVTVFMKDLSMFADMNEVYKSFFASDFPARSAFQVAKLPMDALVEIEAVALA